MGDGRLNLPVSNLFWGGLFNRSFVGGHGDKDQLVKAKIITHYINDII